MTRRYARLAWTAAACTYLLIILGAVVRITGSGLGCGEHWPLCNGRLLPPLDLPTWIEWSHRLVAGLVTGLVAGLAGYTWWLRNGVRSPEQYVPSRAGYVALVLLAIQITLGAVTVKLSLPPWTVILHLGTAMLLLAVLLVSARGSSPGLHLGAVGLLLLAFVTVLLGALTANLGAATACLGFPLCNGQVIPDGNYTQDIHWAHRLLAYTLFASTLRWAQRTRARGPAIVFALVMLQLTVGAAMVLLALPPVLQAAHVAVGAAVWSAVVLAVL
jgi:cytochrome c oxidase assembly protein subunit 15